MLISVMMLMITVTTMKMPSLISMKIGEGFAAEYSHTDEEDGDDDDDANISTNADNDNNANDAKGSHHERKVQFFLTLFKRPLTPPPFI